MKEDLIQQILDLADELEKSMPAVKCIVHGCQNHSDAGRFVDELCAPCYHMITTGKVHPNNGTFIGDMARQVGKKVDNPTNCVSCEEVLTKVSVCTSCGLEYSDSEQIDNNALRQKVANYEQLLTEYLGKKVG